MHSEGRIQESQGFAIPLKKLRRRLEDSWTGHHQNIAVRFEGRRTVCNIVVIRECRPCCPSPATPVVDCRVSRTAGVRSGVENRPVGPQNGRSKLKGCHRFPATIGCRVPELHNCAPRSPPCARRGVIELRIRARRHVRERRNGNIGIHRQHFTAWQQVPSFFVVGIELVRARGGPGQGRRIQQGLLISAAIGLHVRTIRKNYALGVSNRLPSRRRIDRCPSVCKRIIDRALIGPGGDEFRLCQIEKIFATLNDHPTVGKHRGRVIQRAVGGRQ